MKILDCTLRDGGYYTNWDFDKNLVNTYINSCNELPIDYLEVGYRSIPMKGYLGEYFYLPLYVMEGLKEKSSKKLVVILNEKDIRPEFVSELLKPCKGLIDMVRIAIDPKRFSFALKLAESVKNQGFEVGFNVMYMSKWKDHKDFLGLLPEVKGISDYFYMVDSYGGVYPSDVKETIQMVKPLLSDVPLGFHGHNNLELALINTLTAIEEGCEIVDATITGMGRGAGNVKTELLLTALNAKGSLDVDFNPLSKVVDAFTNLQREYDWGTNLPYMVSGAHSLPQKDVMDWVGKRYYSFNSIIRALQNQAKGLIDNEELESIDLIKYLGKNVVIVGGGESIKEHEEAIKDYLNKNKETIIIHSSSKNAKFFKSLENLQIFCLVGNEGVRLEDAFDSEKPQNIIGVLPPFPRKMGTFVPYFIKEKSFQLDSNRFSGPASENVTSIVLELCYNINSSQVFVVGYDGYSDSVSQNQLELFNENEELFSEASDLNIQSLTPTKYQNIKHTSIYSLL
jgi:4-hydroxy 2-oxovalerate aldolase